MITACPFPHEFDVVPHAILSRPLAYFTMNIRKSSDDLDEFESVSFQIGNEIAFDLRKYAAHPDFTASVYLPLEIKERAEIDQILDRIIVELGIPKTAIAWRRGWDFNAGTITRNPADRLRELEAKILFLKIAALQTNCTVTTTFVKSQVKRFYPLSPTDLQLSTTRSGEQLWQQIVGNVIVHKSLFNQGLATRAPGGLRLKQRGLDYLKSVGFAPLSASCQ